jgi:hypothetical protein
MRTARTIGLYAGDRRNCQIVSLLCISLDVGDPLFIGDNIESEAEVDAKRASLTSM